MSRTGRHHRGDGAVGQELNLIPYMDIMVNLVLFMLVNIVSFLSFTILNASIPQLNTSQNQAMAQAQGEELLLVLRIQNDGFMVEPTVTGGKALPKKRIAKTVNSETNQQDFNVASLNEYMVGLKERFPKEEKVLIISQPEITYSVVIKTMDAVRETESGLEDLFPEVTLSI